MVATALVNPSDDEDLALTLNGKKKKINRKDFETAFNNLGLESRQQENIFSKMAKAKDAWLVMIDASFLTKELKTAYKNLINDRLARLKMV
jgi:serine/threonine-protein kinase HipA